MQATTGDTMSFTNADAIDYTTNAGADDGEARAADNDDTVVGKYIFNF